MQAVKFGRRKFAFVDGKAELLSTSITVRSRVGEAEDAFKERLLEMVGSERGTIEIVYKGGRPEYAIITII